MSMTVRYTTIDGEVIAEKRGGVRKLYIPDPLGSTVALLDNTQVQTDTFEYWPYGEVRARTGTTPTLLQFVGTFGYRVDTSTRTYVRARMLDMQKGRWLTQDPIGFHGGDLNLFRYAANAPVDWIDPSGTDCHDYHDSPSNVGPKYRACTSAGFMAQCERDCGGLIPPQGVDYCCEKVWKKIRRKPQDPGVSIDPSPICSCKPLPKVSLCQSPFAGLA